VAPGLDGEHRSLPLEEEDVPVRVLDRVPVGDHHAEEVVVEDGLQGDQLRAVRGLLQAEQGALEVVLVGRQAGVPQGVVPRVEEGVGQEGVGLGLDCRPVDDGRGRVRGLVLPVVVADPVAVEVDGREVVLRARGVLADDRGEAPGQGLQVGGDGWRRGQAAGSPDR
jgi:hypothetical protein